MKKKITAVFLAVMLSVQPWGMAYAGDFSDDISVDSVESDETEEQEDELPDVEGKLPGEDNLIAATDTIDTEDFETETVSTESSAEIDYVNVVSNVLSEDCYYGMYNIDLSGLKLEIHYADKTKEILEFTTEVGSTETDSRGNYFSSEIVHYVDGKVYKLYDDYNGYYDYHGFVPKGSYEVIIYQDQEDESFKKIYSMKLNFLDRTLQKSGNGNFSTTIADAGFIKFIPEEDGAYVLSEIYEDSTDDIWSIYDSELHEMYQDVFGEKAGYNLKGGGVYYIHISYYEIEDYETMTVTAEKLPAIKSIQLEGQYNSATYYTPVNFGTGEKNKYSITSSPWLGKKLKITYENGTTESIGINKFNQFYGRNKAYIVYSGKKDAPEAGTYDVHFELGGKEAVLKNGIQVKTLSQMPAITGEGTKEMAVTGWTAYGCLKTISATSYTIKCEPQTHRYLTVSQLKNGKLEQVLSVENGKSCTLKPNSVYYIGMRLNSSVRDIDKVKFTVSSSSDEIKPSITLSNNSGILVAKLNTTDKIIEHGIVYGKGTNVTLNTPGRTRVAYSGFDSNKSYSFDTAKLTGCTIRAYVIYTDKNGNAQTVYSNAYSK